MFSLSEWPEEVWDETLKPIGYGGHSHELEKLDPWMERTGRLLGHLHPEIREQWIYRHWKYSQLNFIPLDDLTWAEETWEPNYFMENVRTWRGNDELDPDHDYNAFAEPEVGTKLQTAIALDSGKWDYAPIVLRTPGGFVDTLGKVIKANYLLVEGHQRRRYLNALLHRGIEVAPQRVFVLESPITQCRNANSK